MHLKAKYPNEIFNVDGIGKQLDMLDFTNNFFSEKTKTTSDVSIDANANVDDVSVIAYEHEMAKPFKKLNSYYTLWKEICSLEDRITADKIVEMQLSGDIYINDFHGIGGSLPYCFNYSTYDIMAQGLPMINKIKSIPPKYLYSFKSQVEQFTIIAANSTLGATGLADFLVVMSYYIKNLLKTKSDAGFIFNSEEDCWKYVEETLVSFIYTINQPTRGNQSCFTNLSIYDKYFMEEMDKNYTFPDGSHPDHDILYKLQDLFLTIMEKELERTPVTFPVLTACFSIDDDNNIRDNEFLEFIAKHNEKFGNINIYCGKSSTLSSCCFGANQLTLTKSSDGVKMLTFKDLYESRYNDTKRNFTVFHNGSWVKGKVVRVPSKKMYKVTTVNNKELYITEDHINPTLDGNKLTMDLTKEDYLLTSGLSLDSYPEKDQNMSYEQGYLIGMYLGDGSIYKRKDSESYTTSFSLNEEKCSKSINILKKALADFNINANIVLGKSYNNVCPVNINSKELVLKIREWVSGEHSWDKELSLNCLLQSRAFRKGIIDGYYLTDGGDSNRIYTTSANLCKQMEVVFASLGIQTIINVSDRTDESVIIRDEEYKRNFPLYCLRWYSPSNKRSMENVYKIKNNSMYFKIKSLEQINYTEPYVYCFEMDNDAEPYFTLPNGIITHNCRLRSDTTNEYFNSFGSGTTKIGSLGVCTINLPRLAYKNRGNEEKFLTDLKELVQICSVVNRAKRKIIERRIKNGHHPLYDLGFLNIEKQYLTCGINGFNEAIEILGKDILTPFGQELGLKIIGVINDTNDEESKKYKVPYNCEQIPAESVAIKLAEKDRILKFNKQYELYSNQFIPLTTRADLLDRIELQGKFDSHFTGGAIMHCNCETEVSWEKQKELIRLCAKKGVVYFALNYNLQECMNGHMTVGKNDICSICGKPIENNYSRVVGFLTCVKNWHPTRREVDYPNREFYKEEDF